MLISSMVLFYRGEYMGGDYNINRFIYLVVAFVGSIGILIISPNLIRILLGWDGLGLVSYALVIYYQNEKSANAGILTVLSNRIGDVAILLRIGLILRIGRWNFLFRCYSLSDEENLIIKFLIVLAAITKRAQIPFSAWLPAAMAAPTPVSALVHSSTLVTAGVYLIIRFSPALVNSRVQVFLLLISCLTIFISGLGANFEYDLKKIIALSTLRQLGVILRAVGIGLSCLAFFHLLTHALFKALLFICAGVIIHNVKEFQDIRFIGGLRKCIPLTRIIINLSNLALCGTPFLAGFYSKDLILEVVFIRWVNFISFILFVVRTRLTVCYSFRLVYYRLRGGFNLSGFRSVNDERVIISRPILILRIGAIRGGAVLSWLILPDIYIICIRRFIKRLVILVRILGGVWGYIINLLHLNYKLSCLNFYRRRVFRGSIWNIPFLSTYRGVKFRCEVGQIQFRVADKGWREYLGGQGSFSLFIKNSVLLQVLQDRSIKIFIKIFLIRLIILFLL